MARRGRVPPRPWAVVNSKNLPAHEANVVDAEGSLVFTAIGLALAEYVVEQANRDWIKQGIKSRPAFSFSNDPGMVQKMLYRPTHKGRRLCK